MLGYSIMDCSRIEQMTIRQLVDIYNGCGPVRSLKTWKGKKGDLVAQIRFADKQSYIPGKVT